MGLKSIIFKFKKLPRFFQRFDRFLPNVCALLMNQWPRRILQKRLLSSLHYQTTLRDSNKPSKN